MQVGDYRLAQELGLAGGMRMRGDDRRKKPRLPFPVDEALYFHPRKDPIRMADQEASGPSYLQMKRRPVALVPATLLHNSLDRDRFDEEILLQV
ncbi:hypothetical protein HT585_08985 [Ensifer sp. HO-A22]|uniref:Uncharacterized protein n=1 Tax=Ensifer oleiphilus TaxID=2742698 RepID=A0A7Y6UMX7_9HYPH|nr:hypothetical protein [Ensifer oleiphilus]NVD38988.1 hypothetical protein [Ensifer oleiphilus]